MSKKTVRILGTAPSLPQAPPPQPGEETWLANSRKGYAKLLPDSLNHWTRYFNLHSRKHQKGTYLASYKWYQRLDGTKPFYSQKVDPAIPGSKEFPGPALQVYFGSKEKPFRYFTFTGAWLIAFAIYEGFERIELWGYELKSTKPNYAFERPCFFYWVEKAKSLGIEVIFSSALDMSCDTEPGDPDTYDGPLYGYETKPELELL